jgi:hypothetical protein
VREHRGEFDVFHIHFGFDAAEPERLETVVEELDRQRIPLVYTVHDLRNPHHRDRQPHEGQLDLLVGAAAELVTLTPGAAGEVRRRWGREATVLPHPHVVERPWLEREHERAEFVVGVHVKSLRANMDPVPVIEELADAVAEHPGAVLQINIHDEVFEPGNHWHDPERGAQILRFDEREHVRVQVHPYFSEDELWRYLSSLSVSVLPYRFGTHSGWLEACFDLGTAVIAPSCGFYGEQRACEVFGFDEQGFDRASLRAALDRAYRARPPRASWAGRMRERREVARAHRQIYERALA